MPEERRDDWWRAMRSALRCFGLAGQPNGPTILLAAVLIVVGAGLVAAWGRKGVGAIGAILWVVGALIAVVWWVRTMRSRRYKYR
jgi:Flp pilus assembly protein TadB